MGKDVVKSYSDKFNWEDSDRERERERREGEG